MGEVRPGFMLYFQDIEAVRKLSDAQFGRLVRIMAHYALTGEELSVDDPFIEMAFSMIRFKLDHDRIRYEAIREKRRDAGKMAHVGKSQHVPTDTANINANDNINSSVNGNINPMASPDPRITELERLKQKYAEEENEQ